ncbi:MAG: hypothetical protein AAFX00_03200 [Pseudomonadota bacterium]
MFSKLFSVLSSLLFCASLATADERVAIVIHAPAMQAEAATVVGPRQIEALSESLKAVGFDVVSLDAASPERIGEAIEDFARRAVGARFAVFYFAGELAIVENDTGVVLWNEHSPIAGRSRQIGLQLSWIDEALGRADGALVLLDDPSGSALRVLPSEVQLTRSPLSAVVPVVLAVPSANDRTAANALSPLAKAAGRVIAEGLTDPGQMARDIATEARGQTRTWLYPAVLRAPEGLLLNDLSGLEQAVEDAGSDTVGSQLKMADTLAHAVGDARDLADRLAAPELGGTRNFDIGGPEGLWASRLFAGPGHVPPDSFRAYGVLAFQSLANRDDRDRHLMICEAYVASLPSADLDLAGIDRDKQMATVWPINSNMLAEPLNQDRAPCDNAVDHYGLAASLQAIKHAQIAGAPLDGRGPFLLAWSPPQQKGLDDALILTADLSDIDDPERVRDAFRRWRADIERDPGLWAENGWEATGLRVKIRIWADDVGPKVLRVFGGG